MPSRIQRGADVTVEILRKRLRVAYKDADGKLEDVVDGELTWDVHKDESMWSLVPGEHIHVSHICIVSFLWLCGMAVQHLSSQLYD